MTYSLDNECFAEYNPRMLELTKTQRATIKSVFVNCASIIFATSVVGMAVAVTFRLLPFLVGCILFFVFTFLALLADK